MSFGSYIVSLPFIMDGMDGNFMNLDLVGRLPMNAELQFRGFSQGIFMNSIEYLAISKIAVDGKDKRNVVYNGGRIISGTAIDGMFNLMFNRCQDLLEKIRCNEQSKFARNKHVDGNCLDILRIIVLKNQRACIDGDKMYLKPLIFKRKLRGLILDEGDNRVMGLIGFKRYHSFCILETASFFKIMYLIDNRLTNLIPDMPIGKDANYILCSNTIVHPPRILGGFAKILTRDSNFTRYCIGTKGFKIDCKVISYIFRNKPFIKARVYPLCFLDAVKDIDCFKKGYCNWDSMVLFLLKWLIQESVFGKDIVYDNAMFPFISIEVGKFNEFNNSHC